MLRFLSICCCVLLATTTEVYAAIVCIQVTTKVLATELNVLGLVLVTIGGVGAALGSPQPLYGPDGSVALSGEPDVSKRIKMHRRQKRFACFLWAVAVGAFLQAVAISLADL